MVEAMGFAVAGTSSLAVGNDAAPACGICGRRSVDLYRRNESAAPLPLGFACPSLLHAASSALRPGSLATAGRSVGCYSLVACRFEHGAKYTIAFGKCQPQFSIFFLSP